MTGESSRSLAREFDVHSSTMDDVLKSKTWRHVA